MCCYNVEIIREYQILNLHVENILQTRKEVLKDISTELIGIFHFLFLCKDQL